MLSGVTPESLRSGAPGLGRAQLSCLSFPCPAPALRAGSPTAPGAAAAASRALAGQRRSLWLSLGAQSGTEKLTGAPSPAFWGGLTGIEVLDPTVLVGLFRYAMTKPLVPGSSQAGRALPEGEMPQNPGAQLPRLHSCGRDFWGESQPQNQLTAEAHISSPPPAFGRVSAGAGSRRAPLAHRAAMRTGAKGSGSPTEDAFGGNSAFSP